MDVFEAIKTTRAMRRLDVARPVHDDDILTVIEAATRAANGGNRQPVRFYVVRDPGLKGHLGAIYKERWVNVIRASYVSDGTLGEQGWKILRSADHLAEHFHESPVIIAVCARYPKVPPMTHPAEVYPAVQNMLLAARALGLGTTLTTAHWSRMDDVRQVLAVPDDFKVYALVPVGYPTGKWGEAKRRPAWEVTYWDGWRVVREPETAQ